MPAFTVTATQGGSVSNGIALRVKVDTSVAAAQTGAKATQNGAAAHQAAITTTQAGSQVYAALFDVGAAALTANGSTTLFDNNVQPGDGIVHGSGRSTSATVTPGSVTIGASAPADAGLCALAEVLPAGTITEDASSPVPVSANATTVSTLSFTPPAQFVLVAMVSSNGGAGVCTMSLSDTSGLGLTWTEQSKINPAGSGYAGVWLAQLPGAGPAAAGAQSDDQRKPGKLALLGLL